MPRPQPLFAINESQRIGRLGDEASHRDATRMTNAQSLRLTHLKARRKLWLDVHLYLGLFAGLILAVTGLTGSLIAFGGDIDAWLKELRQLSSTRPRPEPKDPLKDVAHGDAGDAI